jgi:hypothetical protein
MTPDWKRTSSDKFGTNDSAGARVRKIANVTAEYVYKLINFLFIGFTDPLLIIWSAARVPSAANIELLRQHKAYAFPIGNVFYISSSEMLVI